MRTFDPYTDADLRQQVTGAATSSGVPLLLKRWVRHAMAYGRTEEWCRLVQAEADRTGTDIGEVQFRRNGTVKLISFVPRMST